MADSAAQWLTEQLPLHGARQSLWCLDENCLDLLPDTEQWPHKPRVLSNRHDVVSQAGERGFSAEFNDFDFSVFADHSLERIFYRVSKEKPLVHHIINEAARTLAHDGQLFLCGHKNDGIKTYANNAARRLGGDKQLRKNGPVYSAVLTRGTILGDPLNDNDYSRPRLIAEVDDLRIFSKPGLFGWQKIDQGSEFLVSQLPGLLRDADATQQSLLDLGCGYGYLSLMTRDLPLQRRVLTDNNAAALRLADINCRENNLLAEVVAADCGDSIHECFDIILCNPPFHQGFMVSGDLTDKFLAHSHRLLSKTGSAFFVVNAFIPLERLAQAYFPRVDLKANNGRFKVVQLRHGVH